ncbi:hypothetical protein [Glycomyces salinus]|uniref:hypothetical protein n=1 Tax=Glycomyces salinus TaxID=980294 RepID=UPI0018EB5845|nr:hypothetical protein [Glycomyces salinus]
MTSSGERSALDPDFVPVHQRIRRILELHPEGLFPETASESIRESMAQQCPSESQSQSDRSAGEPPNFETRKRRNKAEKSALIETLQAAGSALATDFTGLSEQLRSMSFVYRRVPSVAVSDIDLPPARIRAMALHLLGQGVGATEVQVGLYLLESTAFQEDAVLLRELALLGRDFGYTACTALQRLRSPAEHLFWVARRVGRFDREPYVSAISELPDEELKSLLDSLSIAEAARLAQWFTVLTRTMPRFDGRRRLAEAVLAAANEPRALGDFPESHVLIAQLWDAVRFGRIALASFAPGEREETADRFRAALAAAKSREAIEWAQAAHPQDADLTWLRRQIDLAAESESEAPPPGLAIRFTVPAPSSGEDARPHLLIDGAPLVEQLYDRGYADSPERLLQRGSGLRAGPEPRDVRLAEGYCVELCCGALRAEIRRDQAAGLVVWDVRDTGRSVLAPQRFTFEADDYDTEIARAANDFSWEWPARRAARLLRERIVSDPELLSRWDCKFLWATSWNAYRTTLRLLFSYPDFPSVDSDEHWLQFEYTSEVPDAAVVDDNSVAATVERIVSTLRTTDPKTIARVCGGSKDGAEALGYPWPP